MNEHVDELNRIHNVSNPYQGYFKKVLCICSAGLLRSPTAANILYKEYGYNTRAVGHVKEYALIHLDYVHIQWADEIVFVHPDIKEGVDIMYEGRHFYTDINKCVLGIPDKFAWNDKELRDLIKKQYSDYLMRAEITNG